MTLCSSLILICLSEQLKLKQQFKQKFANVSSLADCVSCESCRMHFKLKLSGVGVALKILFDGSTQLERNEAVALINSFAQVAEAVEIARKFREREMPPVVRLRGSIELDDEDFTAFEPASKMSESKSGMSMELLSSSAEFDGEKALMLAIPLVVLFTVLCACLLPKRQSVVVVSPERKND